MVHYIFDGTLTGLLSCVFRAFVFKEWDAQVTTDAHAQVSLFSECIDVPSQDEHAQRVWNGLKQRISGSSLRHFYYSFLAESDDAYQHMFGFAIYIFRSNTPVDSNYGHPHVLGISQWAKQVGREKHRMEAFVRFKKCQDGTFLSLIHPDFNVLPIIHRHFYRRYQDQKWLIYDEKRAFGIYYDLKEVHQIQMDAEQIDRSISSGFQQDFMIELDSEEILYDQLWKDYFNSVNIEARKNLKLHIQYVPRRYWRYMNEIDYPKLPDL